jgi:hypothetical protein
MSIAEDEYRQELISRIIERMDQMTLKNLNELYSYSLNYSEFRLYDIYHENVIPSKTYEMITEKYPEILL